MAMEFWGVEVKPGQSLKVDFDSGKVIHLSQASLGELKDDNKGAKNVFLRLKIKEQNFVLGSLSAGERNQVPFDLIFDEPFELSHDLKKGSVYFLGYSSEFPVDDGDSEDEFNSFDNSSDSSDSEEELPNALENEKPDKKDANLEQEKKPALLQAPKKPSLVKPAKEEPGSDDSADSSDEEDDGDSDVSDDDIEDGKSSDQEEESGDDESDEEEPEEKLKGQKRKPETIASPQKKSKTAPKKETTQTKKSPQSMKNSNKSQKKNSQKKH